MSLDLKPIEARITVEADCLLEAYARIQNIAKSEMLRRIVTEWAERHIEIHTLYERNLAREGFTSRLQQAEQERRGGSR